MHLQILSLCASTSVNKFSSAVAGETITVILLNQVCPCIFYLSLSIDNITPINQFTAPMGTQLEPLESSKPILTPGYELRTSLISMVQEQSFSGEGDDNPYSHLQEFEQTCACLHITGMSHETLKWKLFLFSFIGRAKHWYT
jgi:hypothetical protein